MKPRAESGAAVDAASGVSENGGKAAKGKKKSTPTEDVTEQHEDAGGVVETEKPKIEDQAPEDKALEARLMSHSKFIDHLLSTIPARYYIVHSDEQQEVVKSKYTQNPSGKTLKKHEMKEKARKAKRSRLDPEKQKSIGDLQLEDEKRKQQAVEEDDASAESGEDEEEKESDGDDGAESDDSDKDKRMAPLSGPITAMRTASLDELRARLAARIEEAKAKRKAPGNEKGDDEDEDGMSAHKKKKAKVAKEKEKAKALARRGKEAGDRGLPMKKAPPPHIKEEGNVVFSKFDFAGQSQKKKGKAPAVKLLEKAQQQVDTLAQLQKADVNKAAKEAEKQGWDRALKRAEGEKVLDDPKLIKKSIKRAEKIKRKSAKEWDERKKTTDHQVKERVQKRESNLRARIDQKKAKKTGHKKRAGFEGAGGKRKGK